jgi:hypothetical protein
MRTYYQKLAKALCLFQKDGHTSNWIIDGYYIWDILLLYERSILTGLSIYQLLAIIIILSFAVFAK